MKNLRAAYRALGGLIAIPVIAGLSLVQGLVVGPLTHNYSFIPDMIYKGLRKIFGYKIEFNAASAPLVKDKPVWFLANHMSVTDFITAGSSLNGSFVGKGDILKWPGIAQAAKAGKFIGIQRTSEFNPQSRGKIAKNFNSGFNTIMFPEATTNDGSKVYLFHAGLLSLLYGDKAVDKKDREVELKHEVVVQPIAIRVKSVNGKDATGDASLRALYSMHDEGNVLRRLWKRMQVKNITLELTAFEPLDPKNFKDAKELANTAALEVASVINPGQKTFEKAKIPHPKSPLKAILGGKY